jgi:ABC-type transport system involved in multi-copper enzyme maturation permease subunit
MFHRLLSLTTSPFSPTTTHELRLRMRNPQAYTILTTYLAVASGMTLLIYIAVASGSTGGVNDSSRVGSVLFYIIVGMQLALVSFLAPWLTAGAISGERETDTYDLLRLTLLEPRQIVLSKLISALGYTLLLVFATLPLLSLAILLGGVDAGQMIAALLVICMSAFFFSCVGLYISSRMQTFLGAMTLTYAWVLAITIGIAIMGLATFPLLSATLYSSSSVVKTSPYLGSLIQTLQMIFTSLSPVSSLVVSETNLQENSSLYNLVINPIPGTTLPFSIPAPFILTAILYLAAGILLLWLTVGRLKHRGIQE